MALLDDLASEATRIASDLNARGYRLDFTLDSLREVDRFFEREGRRRLFRAPLLREETVGEWCFGLGAYLGEVLRRHYGATWQVDDADPKAAIKATLVFPTGAQAWPIQRVVKRYREGEDAGIWGYGEALAAYAVPGTPAPAPLE